jgi:hypothetical protein
MSSNTVIQLRKSGTTGNSPSSLNYGELALNWADGKLYYKNGTGIKSIYNQKTFSTVNSNNILILAGSYSDTLSIIAGNNITIDTNATYNKITINSTGSSNTNTTFTLTGSDSSTGSLSNNGTLAFNSNNGILSTIVGSNVTISTPQDIQSSASPSFSSITSNGSINIGTTNIVSITSNTLTTVSTSQVTVDSFPISIYRSAKYFVQMISGTNYHIIELNVIHDGANTSLAQYGEVILGSALGLFEAVIDSGSLQLLFTPNNTVTVVKLVRTTLMV